MGGGTLFALGVGYSPTKKIGRRLWSGLQLTDTLHRKVYRSHSVCFKAIPQGILYLQPTWKTINRVGSDFFSSYYLLKSYFGTCLP